MLLMLLITGVWMLLLHTSLSIESFTDYYVQKSIFGLLEVVTPHLFAMGTVIFILTHFLSLKNKNSSFESKTTLILFSLMLISNLSMFFISETMAWLVWIKIISTFLFLIFSLFIMWRVVNRQY
ncbi:MAG: Unknown protein [uncultured Sulfurovum sp.]|uniref:Uncharacterized protein n=1 Tax=uncultured Sulfurovum sp. TaxID=269237 RepID=A0A6S6RUL4_9BACT|nr:MAG: Unknown protein [uncultured Sulfurovum sp.]